MNNSPSNHSSSDLCQTGAIRFFRRLIATKDSAYFELITDGDLFSPIISVLKSNGGRYNLLDSAILEMFEYIQSEDLLPLMTHVLTNFGPFLESIDYVSTFTYMRHKVREQEAEEHSCAKRLRLQCVNELASPRRG